MKEQIFFHKGLAGDTRSSLQQPGFAQTFTNISTAVEGDQSLRQSFALLNSSYLNARVYEVAPMLDDQGLCSMVVFNGKIYAGTKIGGRLFEWNGTDAWVQVAPKLATPDQWLIES